MPGRLNIDRAEVKAIGSALQVSKIDTASLGGTALAKPVLLTRSTELRLRIPLDGHFPAIDYDCTAADFRGFAVPKIDFSHLG